MLDIASSVKLFAARSCSFENVQKQIKTQTYENALPWSSMTRLRENGFLSDTLIATADGWRPAGSIAIGDSVMTFDHGHQHVVDIQTVKIDRKAIPDRKAYLMHVPKGVLGNRCDVQILPMQEVVIESDEAEALFGDPFVLIPAYMLEDYKGISKTPFTSSVSVTMLAFEREQIIHSNGGLLAVANTSACFSPIEATQAHAAQTYTRLSNAQLRRLLPERPKALPAAFAASSIDDTYAAIEARLA